MGTLTIENVNFSLLERQRKALIDLDIILTNKDYAHIHPRHRQALIGVVAMLDEWSDNTIPEAKESSGFFFCPACGYEWESNKEEDNCPRCGRYVEED